MKLKSQPILQAIQLSTLSLCLTVPLSATVIVDTATLGSAEVFASGTMAGNTDETLTGTFPDLDFSFDQFDPALGTLNSATIETAVTFTQTYTSSASVTPDPDDDFFASGNLSFSYSAEIEGVSFSGGGASDGKDSETSGETVELSLVFNDTLPVGSFLLSDLQGTGTVTFSMESGGFSDWQFLGYFTDYLVQRDAGASATITYDYTPVPEPSHLALIVAGSAFVFYARRRRTR